MVAMLLIGAAFIFVAASGSSTTYTPAQVQQMATTNSGPESADMPVTSISSAQAHAAANSSAVSVETTFTPSELCWHLEAPYYSWGVWPIQQKIKEIRDWCAQYLGGPQTYRASHVFATGLFCNWSNVYGLKVDGGNGYTWTTVRSGAHFYCNPWYFDRWAEITCNTWGTCVRGRHN